MSQANQANIIEPWPQLNYPYWSTIASTPLWQYKWPATTSANSTVVPLPSERKRKRRYIRRQ